MSASPPPAGGMGISGSIRRSTQTVITQDDPSYPITTVSTDRGLRGLRHVRRLRLPGVTYVRLAWDYQAGRSRRTVAAIRIAPTGGHARADADAQGQYPSNRGRPGASEGHAGGDAGLVAAEQGDGGRPEFTRGPAVTVPGDDSRPTGDAGP